MVARNPGKALDEVLGHRNSLEQHNIDTVLADDPGLFDALWNFDRQTVGMRPEVRADYWGDGIGAGAWGLGDAELMVRHGDLYPSFDFADTLSAGFQVGMSQAILPDRLFVGVALKNVWASSWAMEASSQENTAERDSLISLGRNEFTLRNVRWSAGMDLGVLWLPTPQTQLGSSLRDLGMRYQGKFLVPQWDAGCAWYPRELQQEGTPSSRLGLSLAGIDLLDSHQGWKPLSKIAMGADYAYCPLPWRALNLRFAVGLLGGYPTADIGLDALRYLRVDIATWAQEAGWYTGQLPDRKWSLKLALGC
jgi:hypothetical protein